MKVKDLIEELKKCNPEDTVYYDFENSFSSKAERRGEQDDSF